MDAKDFVRIAETGIPFVVDEAYVEYAGLGMSQVQLTKKYKNVLITRTLSKAYGLAGMRFGYAMGDKEVIGQISAALLPWNVGTIPMWAALAAFEDTEALADAGQVQQQRGGFHRRIAERHPWAGQSSTPKPTTSSSTAAGPARKGKDMVAYARRARRDPPPRNREVRQRRLVPRHHWLERREPHGRGCWSASF